MYEDFTSKARKIIEKVANIITSDKNVEVFVDNLLDAVNMTAFYNLYLKLPLEKQKDLKNKVQKNKISLELIQEIRSQFTNTDLLIIYSKALKEQLEKLLEKINPQVSDTIKSQIREVIATDVERM